MPLIIKVANGLKMCSEVKCTGVKLEVQSHTFLCELRVIELGAYDVVLGMDWWRTISLFLWDLKSMTLSFKRGIMCNFKESDQEGVDAVL